jgi:hypothetical protein
MAAAITGKPVIAGAMIEQDRVIRAGHTRNPRPS